MQAVFYAGHFGLSESTVEPAFWGNWGHGVDFLGLLHRNSQSFRATNLKLGTDT